MYKLIACDLDETLLSDEKKVSEQNLAAIKKAKELGVKFVPSTGRGYMTLQHTLKELGLHDSLGEYTISFNGAVITENKNNRQLFFKGLPFETVQMLFEFGLKKDVCIHVYTDTDVYIYRFHDEEKKYLKGRMDGCIELMEPDISFLKDEPLVKILYQNTNIPYLEEVKAEVEQVLNMPLSISFSANRYLEFNAEGVDKGAAALFLANLLHIKQEEIIGIGDNGNDIPLISKAGLGVSVKNGTDAAKAAAAYICQSTNNESAVAEVIEKFVLNP